MKKSTNFLSFILVITIVAASFNTNAAIVAPDTNPICKTWNLSAETVLGIDQAPEASMVGDKLIINEDNTISVKFMGIESTGTYILVGDNTWLSITLADGKALRLKVVSVSATTLTVDYVNSVSEHRIFVFTAL